MCQGGGIIIFHATSRSDTPYSICSSSDAKTAQNTVTKRDGHLVPLASANETEAFKVPASAQLPGPLTSRPVSASVPGLHTQCLADGQRRKSSSRLGFPPGLDLPFHETDPTDLSASRLHCDNFGAIDHDRIVVDLYLSSSLVSPQQQLDGGGHNNWQALALTIVSSCLAHLLSRPCRTATHVYPL